MSETTRERHEAICDASPDAIVVVDRDGEITYANERVRDLLQYDPADLEGEPVECLVPEPLRAAHVGQREGYMAAPEVRPMGASIDLEARRADGTTIPVDISLSPIERDGGVEFVAAIRDIRDRAALRAKYQTIIEAIPDPVVIADAESGEIVEANEQVHSMLGYDPEALVGRSQTVLHPDGDAARYRALFAEHVADDGRPLTQLPDGSDIYVETADGTLLPVEINARVFDLGEETLIAGVFRDVSARRERERQLRELTETTNRLMEVTDREAIARHVADAADTILGYANTVVRLVDDQRLRPVAVTDRARSEIGSRPPSPLGGDGPASRAYDRGEPILVEDLRDLEDGIDHGDARAGIYIPLGDHGVLTVLDTAPDVFTDADVELASILAANAETAMDRLEYENELHRQNDRLDEFASVVSHDLKNPLAVARGWLEAAVDGDPGPELTRVANALDRMEELIDDTLLLARQGRTVEEQAEIDVARVTGECWGMVSTAGADLEVTEPIRIVGDRDRLRRLFENLFRNAVEHGGNEVTVTVGPLEDGFYVADDGRGIPASDRETVFDVGHTSSADGTGFGLSIVREIAEAHGWRVRATESESGGARFEITGVETPPAQ